MCTLTWWDRLPSAAPSGRGQPGSRGHQSAGPHSQDADLGADDGGAAAPALPAKAPGPARAARLTRAQVSAALKRARRRNIPDKATAILAAPRSGQPGQPQALTAACAATVRSLLEVIAT
jgi:hypothetical protein